MCFMNQGEQNGAEGAECESHNSLCGTNVHQSMCIQVVASDEESQRRCETRSQKNNSELYLTKISFIKYRIFGYQMWMRGLVVKHTNLFRKFFS